MRGYVRWWLMVVLLLAVSLALCYYGRASSAAQEPPADLLITGRVEDTQNVPVAEADVQLLAGDQVLSGAVTQADGRYAIPVPEPVPDALALQIDRPHFEETVVVLGTTEVHALRLHESVVLADTILLRAVTPAFWAAAVIFAGMLLIVATGKVHTTLAALAGASLIFAISYLGRPVSEGLFIFDFQRAIQYIDWNVIFLIMGMMIVIAVVERTGLFQWLAFAAYRASGGRLWLLLPILMLVTGVASALLDNVTTMLLMTPISIQIALALGIDPLALLMPEVMASNVIGISTLIGTPTNILIGSYANISFNDFLKNLTPGVLLAMVGLVIYSEIVYRKSLHAPVGDGTSAMLLDRLAERAKITEPEHLRKAGWIGAAMLLLFVFGERIHLLPAVTALMGATALMLWIRPDIEEMIESVDWTTLVFFMSLFIVVGAIQEVGLISLIATAIGNLIGDNLVVAILVITWFSAILSTVIANIPFTAAMLPVVGYLSTTVSGANGKVLFYCLSVGSAMGGNGSLIGASANMVTAGIAERAGHPITYVYFFKKGFPALLLTVSLALIWLLIRFLVL
ncbi:MAG: citrate transporter [Anaerolineae bacterium]|nr:citrate transporter [Anaerolineae bacterium]